VTERIRESRIEEARRRAFEAKQKLGLAAVTAFVAIVGLAYVSHPGSSTPASIATGADANEASDGTSSAFDDSDDFGGFDSFGSIAPSGGSAPQAQTHVS